MDTLFKFELVVDEAYREESFPMQEQFPGPVAARTEVPAAVLFAGRLAESVAAAASPIFIP